MKRRRPVENEACLFALAEREIPYGAHTLAACRNGRLEQHPVRAGNELKPPVLLLRHPWHDGAEVESHDEFGPHGDLALKAADDARTNSDDPLRLYMKSVSETEPLAVVKTVSRISVSLR